MHNTMSEYDMIKDQRWLEAWIGTLKDALYRATIGVCAGSSCAPLCETQIADGQRRAITERTVANDPALIRTRKGD